MEKELITLIEKLAAQLGQTAEAMWHILIAQAQIAATMNFIGGSLLLLTAIACLTIGIVNEKRNESTKDAGDYIIFGIIFFLIFAAISTALFLPAITAAYNPEYWALQKLINMI